MEASQRKLPIGLLGTPTDSVVSALIALSSRIHVVGVFSPAAALAEEIAAGLRTTVFRSVREALDSQSEGLVVLNSGWMTNHVARIVLASRFPSLLSPRSSATPDELDAHHRAALESGRVLLADLPHRFAPSTCRLMELMATALGTVTEVRYPVGNRSYFELCDWSVAVCRGRAIRITREPDSVVVEFTRPDCSFALVSAGDAIQVRCQSGTAVITSSTHIQWKAEDGEAEEDLADDRSGEEVMLDLFVRRAVGGLIATPDLGDLARSKRLAEMVEVAWQESPGFTREISST